MSPCFQVVPINQRHRASLEFTEFLPEVFDVLFTGSESENSKTHTTEHLCVTLLLREILQLKEISALGTLRL